MASTQHITLPNPDLTAAPAAATTKPYLRYFLCALILPLLVWLSAFPLVCSKSYESWGETEWGPVLEFPYETNTPNADIVIFGDSSAFLGIDPRLLNTQLGIHSVVLPSTVGSLPVIGDAPLRAYLAHHTQPKLIVLYFSSWNLDFAHAAPGRLFEGEEMMFRHGSAGQIARYALRHPIELVAFPIRLYSTFGAKMIAQVLHHESRARDTEQALGHAPYLEPFGTLNNLCRIPSDYLHQRGMDSVQQLKQRYNTPGTQVMVYLAPIPNCTNSNTVHDRSFAALGASSPALLPPIDFAGDPYYAHILPPHVPIATSLLAAALKQKLQQIAHSLLQPTPTTIPTP